MEKLLSQLYVSGSELGYMETDSEQIISANLIFRELLQNTWPGATDGDFTKPEDMVSKQQT